MVESRPTFTLIATKLRAPPVRLKRVARTRLAAALSCPAGRKLTLLSAPAGFGKTTLLAETLGADAERASAWFSLDEGDNNPLRFLVYLIGALQTVHAGLGEAVLSALRGPEPPTAEAIIGGLVNDLSALPHGLTLVLDDYHVIESGAVHEALELLLEHLPENVQLVISSRTDPPLPLPRLRARAQLTEIRAADLRFTEAETRAFLNEVMALKLSANEVAALEAVTEGWVAALQLAALKVQESPDVTGFVRAFSGSNRHLLDFLTEEVLGRQAAAVQDFLLSTSVLRRMSAPLCEALTGRVGAQALLERLERDNLFVVPLDDERRWYRYHHLFADFLRVRLARERPGRADALHLRASSWYEAEGLSAEAITHALAAARLDPEYAQAARLIEGELKHAWGSGESAVALAWLQALPAEVMRRRPRLLLERAQALVLTSKPDEALPYLEAAEQAADPDDKDYLLGFAAAIRCRTARLRGELPEAVALGRRALEWLPEPESPHRNFAAVCLSDALLAAGDVAQAAEVAAEAVGWGRRTGHLYGILSGMMVQLRAQLEAGRLREADALLQGALQVIEAQRAETLPATGLVHIEAGVLLYERGDIEAAERELRWGLSLAERTQEVITLVRGQLTLSRVGWARGDREAALEPARNAARLAALSGAVLERAAAEAWLMRLATEQGEEPEGTDAPRAETAVGQIAAARRLRARGRHSEALRKLETLQLALEEAGQQGRLLEVLTLQALSFWALSRREQALITLARALALAEPEGYLRTFLDEGVALADPLTALLEARQRPHFRGASVSARYLARLLLGLPQAATPPVNARLPEPLSERELEVLALIAAGKSNKEIARSLYVSTSTVKTHINNFYRKLSVRSRTQALARAREMSLL